MSQNIDMPVSELVIYNSVQPVDSCWIDILVKLTKASVLDCYLWEKKPSVALNSIIYGLFL